MKVTIFLRVIRIMPRVNNCAHWCFKCPVVHPKFTSCFANVITLSVFTIIRLIKNIGRSLRSGEYIRLGSFNASSWVEQQHDDDWRYSPSFSNSPNAITINCAVLTVRLLSSTLKHCRLCIKSIQNPQNTHACNCYVDSHQWFSNCPAFIYVIVMQ